MCADNTLGSDFLNEFGEAFLETNHEPHKHGNTETPQQRKAILVIDDNSDALSLNRTILEMEGYEVFTAESGKEGLTLLCNIPQPDLVLLDMRMEDMSGPEFLIVLEETHPEILENVPVVFLSAMETSQESRASGFIRKPIDVDKFLEAVHFFIEKGAGHCSNRH